MYNFVKLLNNGVEFVDDFDKACLYMDEEI